MMVDLNKLAAEIHEAAVKKGFWDVEDAEEKHLAKMISELGEVVQADRAGIMYEVEHEGAKPEGVVAELADFVMMLLDYIVYKGFWDKMWGYEYDPYVYDDSLPAYAVVCEIDRCFSNLKSMLSYGYLEILAQTEAVDGQTEMMARSSAWHIIDRVKSWCRRKGYDLWEIIRQKMAYNESRPALHGRLY